MKIHTEVKIQAGHYLPHYDGDCHRQHGHQWRIIAEIEGNPSGINNMVVDFRIVKEIIKQLDHQNLNDFIVNPSAESIVNYLLTRISARLVEINCDCSELKIRVYESDNSYVEDTKSF